MTFRRQDDRALFVSHILSSGVAPFLPVLLASKQRDVGFLQYLDTISLDSTISSISASDGLDGTFLFDNSDPAVFDMAIVTAPSTGNNYSSTNSRSSSSSVSAGASSPPRRLTPRLQQVLPMPISVYAALPRYKAIHTSIIAHASSASVAVVLEKNKHLTDYLEPYLKARVSKAGSKDWSAANLLNVIAWLKKPSTGKIETEDQLSACVGLPSCPLKQRDNSNCTYLFCLQSRRLCGVQLKVMWVCV